MLVVCQVYILWGLNSVGVSSILFLFVSVLTRMVERAHHQNERNGESMKEKGRDRLQMRMGIKLKL